MTAKIISFTDHYNVRRLSTWQLEQISDTYRSHIRDYKHDKDVKDRARLVNRELMRRKELNNARQQSKRV